MAIFAKPETQAKRAMNLIIKHSSYNFSIVESDLLIKSFTSLTIFIKSNRLSADGLRGVDENILNKYLEFKSTETTKNELLQERVAIETYMRVKKRIFG